MSIKHNTDYREDNQQDSQIKVFVRVRPFRNELSRRCLKVV
jgi:kinesin family protein 5